MRNGKIDIKKQAILNEQWHCEEILVLLVP